MFLILFNLLERQKMWRRIKRGMTGPQTGKQIVDVAVSGYTPQPLSH